MCSLCMWKGVNTYSLLVLSILSFTRLLLNLYSIYSRSLKDILMMSSTAHIPLIRRMLYVLFDSSSTSTTACGNTLSLNVKLNLPIIDIVAGSGSSCFLTILLILNRDFKVTLYMALFQYLKDCNSWVMHYVPALYINQIIFSFRIINIGKRNLRLR